MHNNVSRNFPKSNATIIIALSDVCVYIDMISVGDEEYENKISLYHIDISFPYL